MASTPDTLPLYESRGSQFPTTPADAVAQVGAATRRGFESTLACVAFVGECGRSTLSLRRSTAALTGRAYIRETKLTVLDAVPLNAGIAVLLGIAMTAQASAVSSRYGVASSVGEVLTTVFIRELCPLIAAIVVVARSSTTNVAELATARLLGEVRALDAMGADPVQVLALPRIAACAVGVVLLTINFAVVGLLAGMLAARTIGHLPPANYVASLKLTLSAGTVLRVLVNAAVCGAGIGLLSCWVGLGAGDSPAATAASIRRGTGLCLLYAVTISVVFALGRGSGLRWPTA